MKIIAFFFGFLPSLVIGYFSVNGLLRLPQSFLAGHYFAALAMTGFHFLIFIAVATLLRYVFGTELNRLRMASIAGFTGMLVFVIAPFVRMLLVHVGANETPNRSGWDTYGLSVIFSIVAAGPMIALMLLAVYAWTRQLRGTVYSKK